MTGIIAMFARVNVSCAILSLGVMKMGLIFRFVMVIETGVAVPE